MQQQYGKSAEQLPWGQRVKGKQLMQQITTESVISMFDLVVKEQNWYEQQSVLDRDGKKDHSYVHKVEDFDFIEGIFEFCRYAKQLGYKLVVVTNQSGIGRGYFQRMIFSLQIGWQFVVNHCELDAVYFCPYHPEILPPYLKNSDWRIGPRDVAQAIQDFDLDPAESIMVGDNETDMQAAAAAELVEKSYLMLMLICN